MPKNAYFFRKKAVKLLVSGSGTGTIFGQGEKPKTPKYGTPKKGLRWDWTAFLFQK